VIIGALEYALSANEHDILSPLAEHGPDPNLIAIDQHIVDGEERIDRITRIIARLKWAASTRALPKRFMPQ
jgi:hypothetical protein